MLRNVFWHGNCLKEMDGIPNRSVDLILTDLPYGSTKCKWDIIIPFEPLWKQYRRVIKDNGAILLFGSEPFSSSLRLSCVDLYRYDWYWQKDRGSNFLFGNKMPMKVIETISVFYKKQPTYNAQKTINPKGISRRHLTPNPSKIKINVKEMMGNSWSETKMDETENYHGTDYEPDKLLPKQLLYFARDLKNRIHPTQKPVALIEYLIKTYTNEGEVVLDSAAGAATTGIACQNTGRNYILIEKDENYYNLALERLNKNVNKS